MTGHGRNGRQGQGGFQPAPVDAARNDQLCLFAYLVEEHGLAAWVHGDDVSYDISPLAISVGLCHQDRSKLAN